MMYPLVRELAVDVIPVTVTCRVLGLARQPHYRWLAEPVGDAEWDRARLADAVFGAHRDDPEFGYRFLADKARQAGHTACDRTVWRICRDNGWWSVFGKPRARKKTKPGTPAHEDLVRRNFTAETAAAYLTLLEQAMEDGYVSPDEQAKLIATAKTWGLSASAVDTLHRKFLDGLLDAAFADRCAVVARLLPAAGSPPLEVTSRVGASA